MSLTTSEGIVTRHCPQATSAIEPMIAEYSCVFILQWPDLSGGRHCDQDCISVVELPPRTRRPRGGQISMKARSRLHLRTATVSSFGSWDSRRPVINFVRSTRSRAVRRISSHSPVGSFWAGYLVLMTFSSRPHLSTHKTLSLSLSVSLSLSLSASLSVYLSLSLSIPLM